MSINLAYKLVEPANSDFYTEPDFSGLQKQLALDPYDLAMSYERGEFHYEPLDQFLYHYFCSAISKKGFSYYLRFLKHLAREFILNPQRGKRAYQVAEEHYDLGNDLYGKMLDSSMSYTCGYWEKANTLDEAQIAKIDLLCKKLKLSPGMRVLDIGCGFGNFAKYAAEHYGAKVTGVTVSKKQAELARTKCKKLEVEILVKDYALVEGTFDRIVSIEMIEAVGKRNLSHFFKTVHRLLKDEGLFVLQVISAETVSRKSSPILDQYFLWISKYIFPNGYLPRLDELANPARDLFVLEDLHNFGTDYDKTLLEWANNIDSSWGALSSKYNPRFQRRWRFYLLSCAALFRARIVQLYQVVYSKGQLVDGYKSVRN